MQGENVEEGELESYESLATLTEVEKNQRLDELAATESKSLVQITQELVKEVQQELGMIKLCWPQVDLRKDLCSKTFPSAYQTVSGKEKVLAWYAENFRQQFHVKYPNRKPLLLVCENECGVQKFVSTTIRRSTLPYPELYTWQGCGKFVSDYIEYVPLDKALSMAKSYKESGYYLDAKFNAARFAELQCRDGTNLNPKQLRSPTWLQKTQKGNCFECATFLASLLLGEGYNAFVVSGYASREQTMCDLTRTTCPYLRQPEPSSPTPVQLEISKYKLKPPSEYTSQFLTERKQEEEKKLQEKLRRQEEEQQRLIEELEQPPLDKYWGYRIHAWVAILPELGGLRDQESPWPLFIEPSTGVSYKPAAGNADELYLGIESIWNDQNYWVNMQPVSKSWVNIMWDLTKVELWEHVLPGEPWTMWGIGGAIDEDSTILQEKYLDMPFSYVHEININEQEYKKRYPNGTKTMFYKKTKVELYAPYIQMDGLVRRITQYDDYDYTSPVKVHETYANRSDNLVECKKDLTNDSILDYYERGRPDQCREHQYFVNGPNTVDAEQILNFYHAGRIDDLSRVEMHPSSLTQHFINRDDFLYYR